MHQMGGEKHVLEREDFKWTAFPFCTPLPACCLRSSLLLFWQSLSEQPTKVLLLNSVFGSSSHQKGLLSPTAPPAKLSCYKAIPGPATKTWVSNMFQHTTLLEPFVWNSIAWRSLQSHKKKKKQGAQNHHHGRPAPVALPSVFSAVTEAAHFKGAQIHKTAPQSHRLKEKAPCSLCTEDGSTEIPHLLLRGARSTRHRPHHPREVGPEMAAVSGRPQPALWQVPEGQLFSCERAGSTSSTSQISAYG